MRTRKNVKKKTGKTKRSMLKDVTESMCDLLVKEADLMSIPNFSTIAEGDWGQLWVGEERGCCGF